MNNIEALIETFSEEQKNMLEKLATKGISSLTPDKARKIAQDLGLNVDMLKQYAQYANTANIERLHKPKVGQNEKCLCGSGKKYKKCCFGKN